MKLPKLIELFHVPTKIYVESEVVDLTEGMIEQRVREKWWNDSSIQPAGAALEIDRYWDWSGQEIEREGKIIASRKLAVVTGDGAIQGAMMISTEAVICELDSGQPAIFVELLFVSPGNRHWIRKDKEEQFRGIGVGLLRMAAELSLEAGFGGRLKLEASPAFVGWYEKRGLLEVAKGRIVHENTAYTPMELRMDRVLILLPDMTEEG